MFYGKWIFGYKIMRLSRYKRFLESDRYNRLAELLEGISGFEKNIVDDDGMVVLTISLSKSMDIDGFESLFSQISEIEKHFPNIIWVDDDGELVFEFYV